MPSRNRNRRRSGRRPNVFVQSEQPAGRRQTDEEGQTAAVAETTEPSPILASTAAAVSRQQPGGARRVQRTRSEVYARTFPREVRKIGILAAGIVIALTVFTVVL